MSSSSLYNLPVELIYYLFVYLDPSTIFFSFRYVCKRFEAIVNGYNQYTVDMSLISKHDFDHLCKIISPENVFSMILTNDMNTPDQIRTFLSRFSFDQFCHLQSLNLIKIEENNLFSVLIHIDQCPLKSLTINCSSWDTFSRTIRVLLSSTIAKSKLEKLDLNISYKHLTMISCSILPITLKYLTIERCTFQEYCVILRHTINLHRLTLTECLMYNSDGNMYQSSGSIETSKLNSLSFGACFMRMKELLILLSCTPTLNHLKLIIWTDSADSIINGSQWEKFIEINLPFLTKFEFFFDDLTFVNQNSLNIQSYIEPFQTPFWLEKHQWYITCDYIKTLSVIRLYSLPICKSVFMYYTNENMISCSTLITTDNQMDLTHEIHEINLNLNKIIEPHDGIQDDQLKHPIFREVHRLYLDFDGRYPYSSLRFLQTIIDLSSLVRLSIKVLIHMCGQNSSLTDYISSILKKTTNVHSLKITYNHIEEPFISANILCSIIPHSVKHLQISIKNFDEAKIILEQLNQLFSITFHSSKISKYYDDIKKLVSFRRKNSVYREGIRCMQIWLGSSINNDNEKHSVKRVLHRFHFRQAD